MSPPVTLWYRMDPHWWKYVFNHLEEGHATGSKPAVKFPSQDGWKRDKWKRVYAHLEDGILDRGNQ